MPDATNIAEAVKTVALPNGCLDPLCTQPRGMISMPVSKLGTSALEAKQRAVLTAMSELMHAFIDAANQSAGDPSVAQALKSKAEAAIADLKAL
jgi:hypothetical protein